MKRILIILIAIFFFLGKENKAQDMQYTQLYAASIYLNPAFTGANVCSRFTLTYRNQWPGITTAYKSYMLSMDHYIVNKNLGLGLIAAHDVSGTGILSTDYFHPVFAYQTNISRKTTLRLGIQPGLTNKSINIANSLFGDQIVRGGNVATIETVPQSKMFFDAGAGALIYSANYWVGSSFYHLNKPNESLVPGVSSKLPIKYCVQGGAKFSLAEDEKTNYNDNRITLAFNYKGQGKFDQFDIGFYLKEHILNLGIWYRGLPGFKSYKAGYPNNDAVAFIIGIETDRMNFGYSHDLTISSLKTVSKGANELTISYQFCKLKKKKRRTVTVSCPKF
ncbi:MAG: PorP/SprF family type IX secretion system membrane protein [Bacteroidota bacterium]|nr:PorP/SprF family type IX secretion system membrane protein [Bacteroidota bacterium]